MGGSYTKNSNAEIEQLMHNLDEWAKGTRPDMEEQIQSAVCSQALEATQQPIETEKFMGRWHIIANIPTYFEKGATDCTEDYEYDPRTGNIQVTFTYSIGGKVGKQMYQRATVKNAPLNTEWALQPKLGFYLP